VVVGVYGRVAFLVLLALPVTLVAAALATGPLRSALVHQLNLSALLATMAVPAEPLDVRPASGRRLARQAPVLAVLAVDAAAATAVRAYPVALFCVMVLVVATAWRRRWWSTLLPVRLDESGVAMLALRVRVPWTAIATADLASSSDEHSFGVA
jgi:hypothetical protein